MGSRRWLSTHHPELRRAVAIANEGQPVVRRERFEAVYPSGHSRGDCSCQKRVPAGLVPSLVRTRDHRPVGRSRRCSRGDAHALDHNCFHPLDDRGREEVPRCCRNIGVERPQVAETCLVISNHLLERLDKIRLPTGCKHGSALQRRTPWHLSFMHAHRARSFDRGERVPLGKCR